MQHIFSKQLERYSYKIAYQKVIGELAKFHEALELKVALVQRDAHISRHALGTWVKMQLGCTLTVIT
uniref:Uncharacterized protein n=1 Tax=Romanomermis culicivorax TaxID=13658 RepID=A0A915HV08_ROMCU